VSLENRDVEIHVLEIQGREPIVLSYVSVDFVFCLLVLHSYLYLRGDLNGLHGSAVCGSCTSVFFVFLSRSFLSKCQPSKVAGRANITELCVNSSADGAIKTGAGTSLSECSLKKLHNAE